MRWKSIIILLMLILLMAVISFAIYKYLENISNNNMIISEYLKNKNMEITSNYYEHKSKKSTKSDITMDKSLFFIYNPSIQWKQDNTITTIARISGNVTIPRIKNCIHNHFKNTKPGIIKGLSNYFNIFGGKKEGASGIVKFELNLSGQKKVTIPEIINPFYNKNNLANNEILGFEDPRIFKYNGEDWIITYFRGKNFPFQSTVNTNKFGHYIMLFPVNQSRNPLLLNYPDKQALEKNWMPFQYGNKLYIVYSISPHVILDVDMDTGLCKKAFSTTFSKTTNYDIGNGAPAQLIILGGIERYIGLAHIRGTQDGEVTRKNFLYLFNKHPPFNITHMSNVFNILKPFVPIEFGSGLLVDQKKNIIYIAFGVDDCYSSVVSVTFEEIKKLLMLENKIIDNKINEVDIFKKIYVY